MKYNARDFVSKCVRAAKNNGYIVENIGAISGVSIPLIYKPGVTKLISSGMHGNEPAGVFASIYCIENNFNAAFLPLLNPFGFQHNTREDGSDRDPNREYFSSDPPSIGKLIIKHSKKILPLCKDGAMSLHEDVDSDGFYIYYATKDMQLLSRLNETGKLCFKTISEHNIKENNLTTNLAKNHEMMVQDEDTSLENWFMVQGIPTVITVETPAQKGLMDRAAAHIGFVQTFLKE
jgi:predicted deacylase